MYISNLTKFSKTWMISNLTLCKKALPPRKTTTKTKNKQIKCSYLIDSGLLILSGEPDGTFS